MKRLVKTIALVLAVAVLMGMCGCGVSGGKLHATCDKVINSDFLAKYNSDQDKYDYLMRGFNMTKEQLMEEAVYRYQYVDGVRAGISLENGNDFDITVIGLDVKNNGEQNNIVSILPRSTVTLKAGETQRQTVWFDIIAEGSEYSNEEIFECVKGMGLRLIYVRTDSGIETLSDAPEETLIYERVKG